MSEEIKLNDEMLENVSGGISINKIKHAPSSLGDCQKVKCRSRIKERERGRFKERERMRED